MNKTKKWLSFFNDIELIEDKESMYIVIYDDNHFHLGHWLGTTDFQGSWYDKGCWIYEEINMIEEDLHKYTELNNEEITDIMKVVDKFIEFENRLKK